MKGLILKDFYVFSKYLRSSVLVTLIFALIFLQSGSLFYLALPCIIFGSFPVTFLRYDEFEHWCSYALTFPVSRSEYVSAKYIDSIIYGIICSFVLSVLGFFKMNLSLKYFQDILSYCLILSFLPFSITMPPVLKFGAQRSRIIYFIMVGVFSALSTAFELANGFLRFPVFGSAAIFTALLLIFVSSWFISVIIYKNKEL